MSQAGLFDRGADFSACRRYRYRLWRIWNSGLPVVNFVMLNPSSADEAANDPTVERCERRARAMSDRGGLVVTNLFALRSTDPRGLLSHIAPVGADNDRYVVAEARARDALVVCAWGAQTSPKALRQLVEARAAAVRKMLRSVGVELHALALTDGGHPRHPLYLGYELKPRVWEEGRLTDGRSA